MDAFFAMVKKQFIVMTRYPVSFITSFGMVLIFMLLFIFAIGMFVPSEAEWGNAAEISHTPMLLAQECNGTTYLAFQVESPGENAQLWVGNCSYLPETSNSTGYASVYENGLWSIEIAWPGNGTIHAGYSDGNTALNWTISGPLPEGKPDMDGHIVRGGHTAVASISFYGFIFFMFLQDIIWMLGFSLREEQYQGTLESLYLTPVNQFSNLVSRAFINVLWTGLNVIVALFILRYMFGSLPANNLGMAMGVLFLALLQMFGIGFIFAAFTLRAKGSADFVMNFIGMIFMFTCAMFFPFSTLPDVMVKYVSMLIPLSYAVDLFRSALLGFPAGFPELLPASTELRIIIAFAIILPVLGYFLYWKIERMARMKGTLGEY